MKHRKKSKCKKQKPFGDILTHYSRFLDNDGKYRREIVEDTQT